MNISDRYRYLYFTIPKCGSTTVRVSLEPFTDIGYPVSNFEEHVTIEKFLAAYDGASRFGTHFKFTFVRNPYDRIYSGFRQDLLASKTWQVWIDAKKPIFDAIGEDFRTYMHDFVAKADRLYAWEWICFCPMTAFSHRDGKYALDWHGRTENLDGDLKHLGDLLGLRVEPVGHLNEYGESVEADREGYYLRYYTRDTIALVNELYAEDFESFGYEIRDPKDFPETLTPNPSFAAPAR